MPTLISKQNTDCASEPSNSELVVEQEEATVKKVTVPRHVRLSQYESQCEDLIYYLQTNKCRPGLSKKEIRNIKNKAVTHKFNSTNNELIYVGQKKDLKKRVVTELEEIKDILNQYHSNELRSFRQRVVSPTVSSPTSRVDSPTFPHVLMSVRQRYIVHTWIYKSINCQTCDRCQRFEKIKTQAPELKSIKVNEPMELVGMDLIGPLPTTLEGFKYVLTFTDYFKKFVDSFPLKEKAAAGIARCIQTFVCRWGAPCRLLSDQGRKFVANMEEDHVIVEEQLNDDDLEQMVMARVSKMANINEKVNIEQFVYCT
ncbi:Retrovirus-related Pol poly from transposon [Paramuricea clavata]|uniref:Retrovirus-related Pol poly from transposon n=1 Tax=Paramuricea clavata TaxID=317549 RepID=A0A6S7FT69_PARCT|nr:Retrovirus-related Pol poly from transposon [Paramuricea clavata]